MPGDKLEKQKEGLVVLEPCQSQVANRGPQKCFTLKSDKARLDSAIKDDFEDDDTIGEENNQETRKFSG